MDVIIFLSLTTRFGTEAAVNRLDLAVSSEEKALLVFAEWPQPRIRLVGGRVRLGRNDRFRLACEISVH